MAEVMIMPQEIEKNTSLSKVNVIFSRTVELIVALHFLADRNHHELNKSWGENLYDKLSSESQKLLTMISNLQLQGLELLEFILHERIFNDIELLIEKMLGYEEVDFIYKMSGEEIEEDRIKAIRDSRKEFKRFVEEKPWIVKGDTKILEVVIYDTGHFKMTLANLLREINNIEFNIKMESLEVQYRKSIAELSNRLKGKDPLEVAQEIMGKRFRRIFDFKEYFFIPSSFISPHNIRTFNRDCQILVYDIAKDTQARSERGEEIVSALKVISDKTRLEILRQLIAEPTYGKVLANRLDLTTATISHHLEQLKSVGLIIEMREKNIKYFNANIEGVDKLLEKTRDYLFQK